MSATFTVVVPLYNKGAEIGRCVSSVLAQTMGDFELIVVDDGSTDESANVVREFSDPRVKLIQQENAGVAAARNRGVADAQSRWIAFLDADDTWLTGHLRNLKDLMDRSPGAHFLASGYWTDKGNGMLRRIRVSPLKPLPHSFLDLGDGLLVPSCTAMTKVSLDAVGGFHEIFGEDVDLWFRVGALYPMAYSRKATAVWHLDAGNRRTHKIENKAKAEKYVPGGLVPSLKFIESHTTDHKIAANARRYLAARERRTMGQILRSGDVEHAAVLYGWWRQTFAREDRMMGLKLGIPGWIHRGSAAVREVVRRGGSLVGYSLYRIGLVTPPS